MTSPRHLTNAGAADLSFVSYSNTAVTGETRYVATLLLEVQAERFDYNYGYAAIARVFTDSQTTWINDKTAIITVTLNKPLRNAKGLVRSIARKLKKAFDEEFAMYAQEPEAEWENPWCDQNAICLCGHSVNDHICEDGPCTMCGCEYLGQPIEEWYEPREVHFTEGLMGHKGYE